MIKMKLLVCLFGILFLITPCICFATSPTSSNSTMTNEYYIGLTGQKMWVAIRANFSESTNISVRFHKSWSANGSAFHSFCYVISANEIPIISNGSARQSPPNPDRYARIKFGNIDLNYSHNNTIPPSGHMHGHNNRWFNIQNCTGNYDFIVIASSFDTTLEVWITASKNTTFSTTQGSDLVIIQRNDFDASFNIGCRFFTFIKNGERQVTINNNLFAWFDSNPGYGYQRFEYQTPTGNQGWRTEIDYLDPIFINKSDTFDSGLLWGPKGIWTFTTNFWEIFPDFINCPNIYLVGVDLKLP